MKNSFISKSEEETKEIAEALAEGLRGDEVILLYGSLASGKTVFVKGLARGMGINESLVSSPTFTIMNIYSGKGLLFHIDLYRVEDKKEIELLGVEDFLGMGIVAVEWGEKAEGLPWSTRIIKVKIKEEENGERKIEIKRLN